MMAKAPEDRPQSMAEVIQALDASFVEGQPPDESPSMDRRASLEAGRVAANRMPEESDLSGYEVLTDSQSKLWSPLLDAPSEEVPRAMGPRSAQKGHHPEIRRPQPLDPSAPMARPGDRSAAGPGDRGGRGGGGPLDFRGIGPSIP